MAKGYSVLTAHQIKKADKSFLGVKLGRVCVDRGIPVKDVAEYFGVSRTAVYSWFRGESVVSEQYRTEMQKLIDKLS